MAFCARCQIPNAPARSHCVICGLPLPKERPRKSAVPADDDGTETTTWSAPPLRHLAAARKPGPPAPPPPPPPPPPTATGAALEGLLLSILLPVPFRIGTKTVVSIGRGTDNDVVIPVQQVSRHHARVSWDGDGFVIVDGDSANGTYVNNEVVSRRRLDHGDRISIGPFDFDFQLATPGVDPTAPKDGSCDGTAVMAMPGAFVGELSEVSIGEIVQLIQLNHKTGVLDFHQDDRRTGRVVFAAGRAIHAELHDLEGDRAALELLTLRKGSFRFFVREDVDAKRTIQRPTASLLMEAARRIDERGPNG